MHFIGRPPRTKPGAVFILILICYAINFILPFATKTANVEDAVRCLSSFFAMYCKPLAFYVDPGKYFDDEDPRNLLKQERVVMDYSPSGSSKSTNMVEIQNKLLEQVLRKDDGPDWDVRVPHDIIVSFHFLAALLVVGLKVLYPSQV